MHGKFSQEARKQATEKTREGAAFTALAAPFFFVSAEYHPGHFNKTISQEDLSKILRYRREYLDFAIAEAGQRLGKRNYLWFKKSPRFMQERYVLGLINFRDLVRHVKKELARGDKLRRLENGREKN